jgi:RNA polymerase sigma-70 factor (ECF subfamily)
LIERDNITEKSSLISQSNEKEVFRKLFSLYGPKIYCFALAYLKNKTDAEELVQDVFLKIWTRREQLDTSRNVKAYIYKIAVNCIYDLIKKKNLEHAFADFSGQNFQPGVESLWNEVVWNDMHSRFNNLVDQMPEKRKVIFLMSREEGLTNQQIASRLSISKRTVENQIYRATQYLKEHMKGDTVILLLFLFLNI